MAKIFHISEANPIKFTELVTIDDRYNSIQPSLARTPTTINGCYYQKWQLNDATKIQFLSDWECVVKVYKAGVEVAEIVAVEVATSIVGQTFKAYEAEFDFSDYGKGIFYAEIAYINDELEPIIYQSELWQTADKWPDTMLWEYKNSYNNFSVIFETGIVFNFRVEAKINTYNPDSDSEVYVDQMHNNTLLSAIPFKRYGLFTHFLPDWALTVLNFVLSVDEKKGDGEYYEKPEGAKLEITRTNDGNPYGYASIELIPIYNYFLNRLIVGDMADGEYVIYPKRLQWIDNAVNRTVVGKFRINTLLKRIDIVNKSASDFAVKVGTTDGGNELGEKVVTAADPVAVLLLYKLFDSDTTIYITGLDTATTNLFVMYDQDDEVAINIVPGAGSFRWPKGFCGMWTSSEDEEVTDVWDLASGLGKAGTKFENCAIRDGRNGTENDLASYDLAVETLDGVAGLLNTHVGSNTKAILKANLPAEGVPMFVDISNSTPGDKPIGTEKVAITSNYGGLGYEMHDGGVGEPTLGYSAKLGSGTVFSVQPFSSRKLPFKAITD